MANWIKIEYLTGGYLVSGTVVFEEEDGTDHEGVATYAEKDVRAAIHRAAFLAGLEPAELYIAAPSLPPAVEALQERAMADDPQVGGLKAGEASNV
jgi:hypothetical protein